MGEQRRRGAEPPAKGFSRRGFLGSVGAGAVGAATSVVHVPVTVTACPSSVATRLPTPG